jgi:hypothetical protein
VTEPFVRRGTSPHHVRSRHSRDTFPAMTACIPWHVRFRGWFFSCFWRSRFRVHWVRYWESQGISEEQQMEWAAEAEERERFANRNVNRS